ncbi:glycosyltransferase [Salinibacter sp.]|jgi:glycosyltransferase involved in cell wall biosynthesis|uniref:glycosyltransferase n=1 Tax=Salinibacter sp. TaxID=2065818 RepID=UPI0021E84741|nr:glycosyltransferase family A protein [Salinibacter sp.]
MKISVIIPVYNDPSGIDATLWSVMEQDHSDYEVIPVDNNSTDRTPIVIREWAHQYPNRIHPASEHDTQSSYAARNAGIEAAQGEIIVFIDADMAAPSYWLTDVREAFSTSEADYLGYEVDVYVPEDEAGFWGWYDTVMGLPSRYHYEEKQFVPTSCLAVRHTVFDQVGRFDETATSGGDKEFGQRVHRHPDLTTDFRSDIKVFHPARTTFEAHRAKALRVGRGLARLCDPSTGLGDSKSVLLELLLHIVPPDPRRIAQRARDLPPHRFPALYVADWLLRYLRLYGALTYFLNQ